jgi:hypothetical protein
MYIEFFYDDLFQNLLLANIRLIMGNDIQIHGSYSHSKQLFVPFLTRSCITPSPRTLLATRDDMMY